MPVDGKEIGMGDDKDQYKNSATPGRPYLNYMTSSEGQLIISRRQVKELPNKVTEL